MFATRKVRSLLIPNKENANSYYYARSRVGEFTVCSQDILGRNTCEFGNVAVANCNPLFAI